MHFFMYFILKTSSTCFEQTSCSSLGGIFYCIRRYWYVSCMHGDWLLADSYRSCMIHTNICAYSKKCLLRMNSLSVRDM